jgi:hypothetical protein
MDHLRGSLTVADVVYWELFAAPLIRSVALLDRAREALLEADDQEAHTASILKCRMYSQDLPSLEAREQLIDVMHEHALNGTSSALAHLQ